MMGLRNGVNDWATIGHGMVDFTTPFSVYDVDLKYAEIFYNRTNLQEITILEGSTQINGYALRGCTGLTKLVIPDSVSYIGAYAFNNSTSLEYVVVLNTTPPTLVNSNAFGSTNNCPIYVPDGSVNAYKTASQWSNLASRIFSINDMP